MILPEDRQTGRGWSGQTNKKSTARSLKGERYDTPSTS